MAIKTAPPWLKKLGALGGPLIDDSEAQEEIARLKVQLEREDRQSNGELFVGPMAEPSPRGEISALSDILPTPPGSSDTAVEPGSRFEQPVTPPTPLPALPRDAVLPPGLAPTTPPGLGGGSGGSRDLSLPPFVAPPEAPPPPADRMPGTFRFEPNTRPEKLEDEDVVQ